MRCTYCGPENPDGVNHCGHCGNDLINGYAEIRYVRAFWGIVIVGAILIIMSSYVMTLSPLLGLVLVLIIFLAMLLLLAYLRKIMAYLNDGRS